MKKLQYIFLLLALGMLASCGDDEFPVPQSSSVDAKFEVSLSNEGFAPSNAAFSNVSVTREGAGSITYTWNFGDGNTSNEQSPTHLYESPGTYTISLTAVASDDIDFVERTITVKDPNALDAEVFVIDASDKRIYNLNGGEFNIDGFGTGIDYDAANEQIYFTDADAGTLIRANKDGSNMEAVASGLSDPRDIALDIPNGKAYVADRGADAIIEVNIADGATNILFSSDTDPAFLLPVGLDIHNGVLYMTCVEIDSESVWTGGVNGSGLTRIIDFGAGGYGYGLAVDKANGQIYFDDTNSGQILKANLDGSGISSVVDTGNRVYGLSIDNTNAKLYWTERGSGSVFMSDLDGGNMTTLTSDFTDPRGLFHIE